MPYLRITGIVNYYLAGQRFEPGVHEVSEAVAAEATSLKLSGPRVAKTLSVHSARPRPVAADDGNSISPVENGLTMREVKEGTEKARAGMMRDNMIAEMERINAENAQARDLAGNQSGFTCDAVDCGATFPSEPALDRHVEMNHRAAPDAGF